MPWTVETLNALVDEEVAELPDDMRARLARLSGLIEQIGFEALPREASSISKTSFGSFASPAAMGSRGRST